MASVFFGARLTRRWLRLLASGVVCIATLNVAVGQESPFSFDGSKPEPPKLEQTIYDLLAVGATSPSGVSSEGLDPDQLLLQAEQALNATPPRSDEALYWLRKMVAGALGDPERNAPYALRTLAAKLYASDGQTKENMRRLEYVWQLLAVTGDGRAMCNIGRKYKDGIGVPKDSRLARQWYERARDSGCGEASQALSELGR